FQVEDVTRTPDRLQKPLSLLGIPRSAICGTGVDPEHVGLELTDDCRDVPSLQPFTRNDWGAVEADRRTFEASKPRRPAAHPQRREQYLSPVVEFEDPRRPRIFLEGLAHGHPEARRLR